MREFSLFVNGLDLETGKYRYFPNMEAMIRDPSGTLAAVNELKRGGDVKGAEAFVAARYAVGTEDTNRSAIQAAAVAAREFRSFPLAKRKKICLGITRLLKKRRNELLDLLITEGHPRQLAEWELRGMETGGRKEAIDFYASSIRIRLSSNRHEEIWQERRPDGVVCVCPPANAPASNSYLAVFALLAGNTLIIKPPLANPASTIFLWRNIVQEVLAEYGAPAGTINIILGNSQLIMEEWLASPLVNDILFFGDSKTGLDLGANIYSAGKKPILELSGNDLLIVWRDADIDGAVRSAMGAFLGSTQICMVPKLILVHEKAYRKFVDELTDSVRRIRPGYPSDPGTILSPVARMGDFFSFLEDAREKGARLLCGGVRVNIRDEEDPQGLFIRPALLEVDGDIPLEGMRCFREEIFFPLLPLVRISGTDEEIFGKICGLADRTQFGLRLSLWTASEKYLRRFSDRLANSGLLRINLPHVEFSPFLSTHGGRGRSGGPFGEMNHVWQKTSHLQGISRAVPCK